MHALQPNSNHVVPCSQALAQGAEHRSGGVWLTATALVNEVGEVYAIATTERARGLEG